jgi:hypothetical protein
MSQEPTPPVAKNCNIECPEDFCAAVHGMHGLSGVVGADFGKVDWEKVFGVVQMLVKLFGPIFVKTPALLLAWQLTVGLCAAQQAPIAPQAPLVQLVALDGSTALLDPFLSVVPAKTVKKPVKCQCKGGCTCCDACTGRQKHKATKKKLSRAGQVTGAYFGTCSAGGCSSGSCSGGSCAPRGFFFRRR